MGRILVLESGGGKGAARGVADVHTDKAFFDARLAYEGRPGVDTGWDVAGLESASCYGLCLGVGLCFTLLALSRRHERSWVEVVRNAWYPSI